MTRAAPGIVRVVENRYRYADGAVLFFRATEESGVRLAVLRSELVADGVVAAMPGADPVASRGVTQRDAALGKQCTLALDLKKDQHRPQPNRDAYQRRNSIGRRFGGVAGAIQAQAAS